MIGRITNYLPSFSRTQESSEDDDEESYESASSGGLFEDSQSDIEPTRDSPDVQKKTREGLLSSAVQNSVYPPLSSIGTQATTESVASVAVGSAESNLLSSHIKEGFFVDLDPADSFVQSSPLVQSAGGKKMSNSSKGSMTYKNDLQTFCQRNKRRMPKYGHEMEGPAHVPLFRAWVKLDDDGELFESDGYHCNKVEAEQAAAKKALTKLCPGFSSPLERQSKQQHQQMSNSAAPKLKNTDGGSVSVTESISFSKPQQRLFTPPHHQVFNSAPSKLNFNAGGSGTVTESIGSNPQISAEPVPSQELPSVFESPQKPFSGLSSLRGASSVPVKTEISRKKRRALDGLTFDTPIDLTMDEQLVGSNPPLTKANSPACSARSQPASARSQPASNSYDQFWGALNSESFTFGGFPTPSVDAKKPPSSVKVAAPVPLETQILDVEERFAGLQVKKNIFPESKKQSSKQHTVPWPTQTDHLKALGMLEFATHAFPLLTRLNGLPLEEAYSLEDIEGLRKKPAADVHTYLNTVDGRRRRPTCLLQSTAQTDPDLLLYDCHIFPEKLIFRATENKQGSNLLQRTLGFDKVLRVFFDGIFSSDCYKGFLKNGIFVGPRHYQYFVYKPADSLEDEDEKKDSGGVKCYFVCTDSRGSSDSDLRRFQTITEARALFMHVHNCATVPKYIKRLHLCLSKTLTINEISFPDVSIEEMEDLASQDKSGALFTDGTGFISPDLAKLMPLSIFKGMTAEESESNELYEEYPTLIQVSFFHDGAAHKGTLLVNQTLPPKTIQYFKPMKKVECDPALAGHSISSFELVSTSHRPRRAKLSQDLIVLLSIGGVDASVFIDAVNQAAEHVLMVLEDRKRAIKEVLEWEWESDFVDTTFLMLAAGIPLTEPGLRKNLLLLIKNKMNLFAKGKVPLEGTFYLMGTADPSGTLKPNEVVILLNDGGNVCGPVIVYRAPGKHKVEAVHSQALQDIVGFGKNVIFFSTQGDRPITHEIANGDLDGDMYWICRNKKVVEQFREYSPRWSPNLDLLKPEKNPVLPRELSPDKLEDALINGYLNERFNNRSVVGKASKRWLIHIDGYLHPATTSKDKEIHKKAFLKYPDYIYEGIDMKSGNQLKLPPNVLSNYDPPYLRKSPFSDPSTRGKSILGMIYDLGSLAQGNATGTQYSREQCRPDKGFQAQESRNHMVRWERIYEDYLQDMTFAVQKEEKEKNPDGPQQVNMKYKRILYGGPSFKERTRSMETILAEASAIYEVVYTTAAKTVHDDDSPKVSFAWNVAGPALALIYCENQPGGNALVWAPGLYKQVHKRSKAQAPRVTCVGIGLF